MINIKSNFNSRTITLLLLFGFTNHFCFSQTIHVPADYGTIQEAIDQASDNDTILVSPGTYFENIVIDSINIVIGSMFLTTGEEDYISQTIIDGSNVGRAVLYSNVNEPSLLAGFTIQHGEISGNLQWGAGIAVNWSYNITLTDLKVISNISERMGGGIAFYASTGDIINTEISNNISTGNPDLNINGLGGGMHLWGATVNSINCNIHNNGADLGAGVYEQSSSNSYMGCTFANNTSTSPGGGVCTFNGNVEYENCFFNNNSGDGAIYASDANVTVSTCLLTNNDIAIFGSDSIELKISNSTITNNNCILNPIRVHLQSNIYILNSILWDNCDYEIWLQQFNNLHVSNSIIKNGINGVDTSSVGNNIYWHENILSANPSFVNDTSYYLSDDSPCIGTGADSIEMNNTWLYSSLTDYDNNPRPLPSGSFPDIGAFENPLGNPTFIFENNTDDYLECLIYPNPAQDELFLSSGSKESINKTTIFNQLGQVVFQESSFANKIDVSGLDEGIYIIELTGNNLNIRRKLVIKQ